VTDSIDFHDYSIESLLVEAKERRLVLRAFDPHAPSAPSLVAEFSGLAGYCLLGDVLGTIVFELEEREPFALYQQFAPNMQAVCRTSGGHDPWARSESEAAPFLVSNGIRGFELSSSIGAIGGIWCRGFRKWIEPSGAA
jgi:hypothetical protein